jgi:hypothetical protein
VRNHIDIIQIDVGVVMDSRTVPMIPIVRVVHSCVNVEGERLNLERMQR